MEAINEMITNEVAEQTTTDVSALMPDTNAEITDVMDNATPQFGLKEGLVLGGLIVGTVAVGYTVFDLFKRFKKRHDEKKAAATMAAMDTPVKAPEEAADQAEDKDLSEDTEE